MATPIAKTLRRALLAATTTALLLGVLHYVVGVPLSRGETPAARLSVATQATGATVVSTVGGLFGQPDLFDDRRLAFRQTASSTDHSYRPPMQTLLLIALGNLVLLAPLFYLVFGAIEQVRERRRRAAIPDTPDPTS